MSVYNMDDLDAQIEAYLKLPVRIGKIPKEFSELPNLTMDMRPVTLEFPDDKFLMKPGIKMYEMTSENIISIGRVVIPMIASGFTRQGAAFLFTLAYNLVEPGRLYLDRLFRGIEQLETAGDKNPEEYSDRQMATGGNYEKLIGGGPPRIESAVYSYLAMSMMRLFTKSPETYVRSWNHILTGFSKFYPDRITFHLPTPTTMAMKSLSDWFSMEPQAKQALYRILFMSNANDKHQGFKRFLFETHLAYTGMHLANFFLSLCKQLNCSLEELLQVLNAGERQIHCLVGMMKIIKLKAITNERGMWKYGRIFDETFMYDIRTKACPQLVYILGSALKMEDPRTYANFDKIEQLRGISDVDKKRCRDIAVRLIKTIRENNNSAKEGSSSSSNK